MKMNWSNVWKSSKNAGKQRLYKHNAPLHVKGTFLAAHLSKELREKYQRRNARVRTGDTVTVLRGDYKGKSGKIERVDTTRSKIYITGVESVKKDGTKTLYPVSPSNVMVTSLEIKDKKREQSLRRKVAKDVKKNE